MNTEEQEVKQNSLQEQLHIQQEALVKIYTSVEQTRKIMLWTGIANLVVFILPLIFVVMALPSIMNTFTSSLNLFEGSESYSETAVSNPSLRESLENLQNLGF